MRLCLVLPGCLLLPPANPVRLLLLLLLLTLMDAA
jgi:hypothetical protein